MSTYTAFERAKLIRFINVYGNSFSFKRSSKNDYNEPKKNEPQVIAKIDGVYHEAGFSHISKTIKNGGRYTSEVKPMILCLDSEAVRSIMPEDYVEIFSRIYKVNELKSIGGYDYAWDISLELVEDGNNA